MKIKKRKLECSAEKLIAEIGGSKWGSGCAKGVIMGANCARRAMHRGGGGGGRGPSAGARWRGRGPHHRTPRRALSAGLVLVRLRPVLDMQ